MPRPKGSKNKPKDGKAAPKAKGERKKFQAPVNTKTGAAGAANQGPKGAPATESVKPSEVRKVTGASTLKQLLRDCSGHKTELDEITGSLREKIGYAVQHKGLDKRAFGDLRKIDALASKSPEKASDYWHTLVRYMELTGVMAKIDSVGRLPLGDDDAPQQQADGGGEPAPEGGEPAAQTLQPADTPQQTETGAGEKAEGGASVSRPQFGQRAAGPVH